LAYGSKHGGSVPRSPAFAKRKCMISCAKSCGHALTPAVIPAKRFTTAKLVKRESMLALGFRAKWIPAFAGMTA
jgi:hypothetical protein